MKTGMGIEGKKGKVWTGGISKEEGGKMAVTVEGR